MTTDRKNNSTTNQEDARTNQEEAPNKGGDVYKNLFNNLEEMDGNSTLMAGFDDDSSDDPPPPLIESKNLPINQS